MKTFGIKDIRARYGVGEHTALQWIRQGILKAIDVSRPGSRRPKWRCTEAALAEFEALRQSSPPPPKPSRRRRNSDYIEFYK